MGWFSQNFGSWDASLETASTLASWATGGILPIYGSYATLEDRIAAKREADAETLRELTQDPGAVVARAGGYIGGAAGHLVEATANMAAAAASSALKSGGIWVVALAAAAIGGVYILGKR